MIQIFGTKLLFGAACYVGVKQSSKW